MNRPVLFLCGLYAFALLTGRAFALEVAPAGPFTAQGMLALGKGPFGVDCTATVRGRIATDGALVIEALDFGRQPRRCRLLQARGLPWRGRVDAAARVHIEALAVELKSRLVGGVCGPAAVVADWQAAGSALHFAAQALPRDCTLQGRLVTTPALTLSP